jgi:type IV secretory pathway TraG/TraD family ATPase VirD4
MKFFGFFITAAILAAHWFYVRHLDLSSGATRLASLAWYMVALPIGLSAWTVWPSTGASVFFLPVAWLVGMALWAGWNKVAKVLGLESKGKSNSQVLRGREIISEEQAIRWLKKSGDLDECRFKLGGVPVPEAVETRHFLLTGGTGAGKTQAFFQIADSARKRGHRAIVADLGGAFIKRYMRHGKDTILNPFDQRTVNWSPFAEMRQSFDAARLADSMVPRGAGGGESEEWKSYARTLLRAILQRLFEAGAPTNQALVYYSLAATKQELSALCAGTPAEPYFQEGQEKFLGSVKSTLSHYIEPLTFLRPETGADAFSIRKWAEEEGDGWLFISYRDDQLAAIAPLIASQIDTAASAVLSGEEDLERRTWFFLDEFATLGKINSVEPLLNKGRKYGVCAALGYQSIGQPRETYGREKAQAILAGLSTWVVLRQNDPESAEYMSLYLGDEEIRREIKSSSNNKDSTSENTAEQYLRQRAIMPAELQQLADLQALVNIAGPLPPAWTQIPLSQAPQFETLPPKALEEIPNFRPMLIQNPAAQLAAPGKKKDDDDGGEGPDFTAALR